MKKFLIVLFAALGLLAGCSSNGKPAISVSASSSSSTVVAGGTAQITATVSNDSSGKGVTWTATCSAAPCGSVSPTSSTSSPYTTSYTAPGTPPANNLTVTITATSVSDSTKSSSVTVTVPAIAVSINPSTPQTVNAGSSKQFTATVANDPANGGVGWKVSCSTAPCGSVSPTSTASGTATTYTAPSTPPASNLLVTLTATSASDGTKSASVQITVPAVSVSVSPSTATLDGGQNMPFTATVSGTSNTAVTWAVSCSAAPCGSLNSTTSNPVTYTAPAPPPNSLTVTLTATSSADPGKSGSATITVPAITVSVAPSAPSVAVSTTQNFTATVSNDAANNGVNWTLQWNGSACTTASTCGSLSNKTATGVTYNAPASVPSPATVTLTATSKDDTSKSASATITITTSFIAACNNSGSESLLNGHYAFLLKGFDNGSPAEPALVGGVITVDGSGNVTAGTMDMNLAGGMGSKLTISSGSYSIGSDHRGCMTLTVSGGTPAVQDYRFSVGGISSGVASTGHMIDFNSSGPFTAGVLLKQYTAAFSTTAITGNYAFGGSSAQNANLTVNSNSGGKVASAGVFNLLAGAVTGGEVDINGNGELDESTANSAWPSSPISIDAGGTYTIDGTSGRGTLTYTPNGAASAVTDDIYVVSSSEILYLQDAAQGSNTITAGKALKQSGSFSNTTLNGTSVTYISSMGSVSGTTGVTIGLLTTTGSSGTLTFNGYQNDGGAFSIQSASGSFSVDSTGRVILTGAGLGNHAPLFYMVSANQGFFLGSNGGVDSGFFEPQVSGPFSAASAKGTYAYGSIDPGAPSSADNLGVTAFDGSSTFSITYDQNGAGSLTAGAPDSGTYSIDSTTGLGHIPLGCSVTASSTTCENLFLVISPTKLVLIGTGSSNTDSSISIVTQ